MSLGLALGLGLGLGSGELTRCWIPVFGAADREISIPTWTSTAGATIDFELNYAVDTGNRYQLVIASGTASASWFGVENGKFRWDSAAYSEVKLNGTAIANNTTNVVYGTDYVVELTLTAGKTIGTLGNGWTGSSNIWFPLGGIRNLVMVNGTDDRFYPGIIKQKGAPTTTVYVDNNPGAQHGTLVNFPAEWTATTCSPLTQKTFSAEYGSEYV